jgi:hypothetical protein
MSFSFFKCKLDLHCNIHAGSLTDRILFQLVVFHSEDRVVFKEIGAWTICILNSTLLQGPLRSGHVESNDKK